MFGAWLRPYLLCDAIYFRSIIQMSLSQSLAIGLSLGNSWERPGRRPPDHRHKLTFRAQADTFYGTLYRASDRDIGLGKVLSDGSFAIS